MEFLFLTFRTAIITTDDGAIDGYQLGSSQLEALGKFPILGSQKSTMRHAESILHGATLTVEGTVGLLLHGYCQRMGC